MSTEIRQHVYDSFLAILLVAVLFFVVNPLNIWMTSQLQMVLSGIFAAVFAVFIAMFWRESPRDEREEAHAAFAGRVAFFAGSTTMALGVVIQSIQHTLDGWLPTIFIIMIISKSVARAYASKKR